MSIRIFERRMVWWEYLAVCWNNLAREARRCSKRWTKSGPRSTSSTQGLLIDNSDNSIRCPLQSGYLNAYSNPMHYVYSVMRTVELVQKYQCHNLWDNVDTVEWLDSTHATRLPCHFFHMSPWMTSHSLLIRLHPSMVVFYPRIWTTMKSTRCQRRLVKNLLKCASPHTCEVKCDTLVGKYLFQMEVMRKLQACTLIVLWKRFCAKTMGMSQSYSWGSISMNHINCWNGVFFMVGDS